MSKPQWLMVIGLWLIVLPFLGFPSVWDKALLILTGLVIVWIAFKARSAEPIETYSKNDFPFIEHKSARPPLQHKETIKDNITPSRSSDIKSNDYPTP